VTTANSDDRLDSWKEIATFLRRDVRTVQRWEKNEGLPVHRHQHEKLGSVYAFPSEITAWVNMRKMSRPKETQRIKLAVLPFGNLGGNPDDEYFADGLAEDMITHLTRLDPARLAVIARDTGVTFKAKPLEEIRRELRVDYVLRGSVRRASNRLRITAQLISLEDQTQTWAETYERDWQDILWVQADIAQAIGRAIRLVLAPREITRLSDVAPEAYDAYLKGRYHLHDMSVGAIRKSLEEFERAIRLDAGYAPAYAALANACALLAIAPFDLLPPHQAMPKAEAAARKSLELDDSNAEAHTALALVQHHYRWDWASAESSYRRAIELNPTYASAHLWYSWLLLALDRRNEALAEIERTRVIVQETDPHRLVAVQAMRATAYYFARDFESAAKECERALEMSPNYFLLHYILGRAYARLGKHAKAIAHLQPPGASTGEIPLMDAALGLAYSVDGKKEQGRKALDSLHAMAQKRYVPATYFGMLYAGLDDQEQALDWLERAYEERADGLTWLGVEPMLDGLRDEPRFRVLVSKMGLG
jgi:TolB-like protein/Flp pilus assembly protein TadD